MAPDIEAELAKKGLQADGRNALQGVAQGDNLSAYHRQLLTSKTILELSTDEIIENRQALLLAKYAMGGSLTKDQEDEIRPMLDEGRSIGRRIVRENYLQKQEWYAEQAGYDVRNIKKWIKAGKARTPIDLPPLDTPNLMPAWWGRNMKQKCPGRVLLWASGGAKAQEHKASCPAESETSAGDTTAPARPAVPGNQAPSETDLPEGKGYAATLLRWQQAERVAHRFYEQALNADPFNEGLFEQRRRAYERASEMVRKLEIGKEEILATDDEWGRWEDFEEQCAKALSVLANSLRSQPVRIATKLALTGEKFQEFVTLWNAELDYVFDALARMDYRQAVKSEVERDNLQLEPA